MVKFEPWPFRVKAKIIFIMYTNLPTLKSGMKLRLNSNHADAG